MSRSDLSLRKRRLLSDVDDGHVVRAQVEGGVRWRISHADAEPADRRALDELAAAQLIEAQGFKGGSTAEVTLTEAGQAEVDKERAGTDGT